MSTTPTLSPREFARVVALNGGLDAPDVPAERRVALASVVESVAPAARESTAAALRAVPAAFGAAMGAFGWAWNGYYVLRDDGKLHRSTAYGPPVCAELERADAGRGGPLSSGMCFDALLLNQTLAARDAKSWPGYVSCDATSGIATASGIVAPIRAADGAPIAVWDLDATQPVEPVDVRFVDVFFATLGRCLSITPGDFAR